MKRYINAGTISILVLVIFALLKFIPFISKNQVPVAFDIFLGAYYPWLSDKWGYAVGVPVKNPLLSDVVSQTYPWLSLARDQILSGYLPLWNSTSLAGYPFLANYQMGWFYPTSFLLLIGNLAQMRTVQLFVGQLLGQIFMYVYLRSLKISRPGSIVGAIIFITAGHMTTDFELSLGSRAMIWLPLALYLINMFRNRQRYWLLLPLALCEFSIVTAGQVQTLIFANLIILASLVLNLKNNLKSSLLIALALFLGFLASAPQLLPTAELFSHSVRLNDPHMQAFNNGIIPWKHLLTTFIAPDIFGNPSTGNYFGFWDYLESVGYVGVISSIFVYLSFLNRGNNWLKIGLLLSLLFSFDNPIAAIPYRFHIPLLDTSAAARVLYPMVFFVAVLAATGLDSLKKRKYTLRQLIIPIVIFAFMLAYFIPNYVAYSTSPHKMYVLEELGRSTVSFRNLLLPTVLFFVGIATVSLISRFMCTRKIFTLILIIIISLDLLRFHYKYNSYINQDLIFPDTLTSDYLKQHPGRFVTTSSEVFPSNSWSPYHLDSLLGYENLAPSSIAGYFATMNTGVATISKSERYLDSVGNYSSPLLDLAGVKYIITLKRDKVRKIDPNGYLRDDSIDLTKYKPVFTDRAVVILENQRPVGISYLNYSPVSTMDDYDTLNKMMENKDDQAIYTSDKFTQPYHSNYKPEILALNQDINGDMDGEFTAKGNGILNISTTNYPGWIAYLDEKPVKIIKSNFLFIGIEIPAGKHTLRLTYQSKGFIFGVMISVLSTLTLFTVIIIGERHRKDET